MIVGHLGISEKLTKNDPEIVKVEPRGPVKVVTPTIFEFSSLENFYIPDIV